MQRTATGDNAKRTTHRAHTAERPFRQRNGGAKEGACGRGKHDELGGDRIDAHARAHELAEGDVRRRDLRSGCGSLVGVRRSAEDGVCAGARERVGRFRFRCARRSGADVAGRTVASRVKLLPVAVVVSE